MFFDLDLPYNINVFEIVSYNYFFSVFQKSEKNYNCKSQGGGGGKIYPNGGGGGQNISSSFFKLLFCFLVGYYIAFWEHIIIRNWSFYKLFSRNNTKITIKKCSFIETIHFPPTNSHFFLLGVRGLP